ncbi:hypothetical protein [Kribbella sp.]|uniref:hypothetical protein n=1 Tax=Kribbella sp. TaxID=1871183 RepID=UPI002D6A41C3|nr:hypothetical protein [Kribbella sp.]HZX08511.1 hypothetical protein [Kribbella sp.]
MEPSRATTRRHLPTSPFSPRVAAPIKTFEEGDRVSHDREGIGRITAVEGTHAVVVDLGGKLLRVMSPFDKLHVL